MLDALRAFEAEGLEEAAALVTIVRTKGSTFRRVGAAMLVRADGSAVNPLAGGCPHRDLVERAREVMATGQFCYVAYNEDHGLDLLLESGCGGMLEVAIEPLSTWADIAFLGPLEDALAEARPFLMTTLFPPEGVGHAAERVVAERDESSFRPRAGHGLADFQCGADGRALLVELFGAPVALVIAGAGDEAVRLAVLASTVGMGGIITESSAELLMGVALPQGWLAMQARPDQLALLSGMGADTAMVTMTHNLERDIDYLRAAGRAGAFYLGALGSRNRAALIRAAFDAPGLRVPAGLDIGSNTPSEIALAVLAEILACRHGRMGAPLSVMDGALHQSPFFAGACERGPSPDGTVLNARNSE